MTVTPATVDALAGTGLTLTENILFYDVTLANFTDSNLSTPASDLQALIDWGDGTHSIGKVTGSNGAFQVSGSHLFADPGQDDATITLVKVGSTATATASTSLNVGVPLGDALGGEGGTLSGTGGVGGAADTLSGTASAIISELEALIFTPIAAAPNSAGGAPIVDSTTSVIDSDPAVAPPPPPLTGSHDILFQNVSGQLAGWEVTGASLTGSALLGANPGPSWRAVGTGDFNDDSRPDILFQNTSGQVAIWEMMNGTNLVSGAVVASPGANWKAVGTGDFNDDHHSDILLQNTNGERRASGT